MRMGVKEITTITFYNSLLKRLIYFVFKILKKAQLQIEINKEKKKKKKKGRREHRDVKME